MITNSFLRDRKPTIRKSRRRRLFLEPLEDRQLLAVVALHKGATNPSTEGWTQFGPSVGVTEGPVPDAWSINDTSTALGSGLAYQYTLSPTELNDALSQGWTIRATVNVVNHPDNIDGSVTLGFSDGISKRWILFFGAASNGDPLVRLADNVSGPIVPVSGSGFHDYELTYDPGSGTVDFSVDGVERLTDHPGFDELGIPDQQRFLWGAGQSTTTGHGLWSFVEFEILDASTTEVTLDANGDLLIEDIRGGDTDDDLALSFNGTEIVITDSSAAMQASVGTAISAREVRVPLASIPGDEIRVNAHAGDDSLAIDVSMLSTGLTVLYDGGDPATPSGDSLTMDLTDAASPVVVDPVGGTVIADGRTFVQFSDVETRNITDAGETVGDGELFVRTTDNREAITFTLWNDGGVKLRVYDYSTGSGTSFPQHFGLAAGVQSLERLTVHARGGDDSVTVASHVVDRHGDPIPVEFHGEEGNDYLAGGLADDILVGGPGNDRIHGGEGNNYLSGGDGDDRLTAKSGDDVILGGAGNDRLLGGDGSNFLDGGDGDDLLSGGLHDDVLIGGTGDDTLSGYFGNNVLVGGEGHDELIAEDGHDMLFAGAGRDYLRSGAGNDLLVANRSQFDGLAASDFEQVTQVDATLRAVLFDWQLNSFDPDFVLGADEDDDDLFGELGADWFFAHDEDRVRDFQVLQGDRSS